MTASAPLIIAITAAVAGPLAAWITAARKLSGKIDTTDADQLWAESASIREDYRSQLLSRDQRISSLEARVASLEQENNALVRENLNQASRIIGQLSKIDTYEEQITKLMDRLTECERKLGRSTDA